MKNHTKSYEQLAAYCHALPVVDCHDHSTRLGPKYADPIQVVIGEYFLTDIGSVTSEDEAKTLLDASIPWQDRWPILEKAWPLTCHTGFAQITRRVLKKFYDEEEVTFAALQRINERLLDLDDWEAFDSILEEAGIVVRLEDVWPDVSQILDGTYQLTPRGRLVIPLPAYHRINNYQSVQDMVAPLTVTVTTLDQYVEACYEIFNGFKTFGAVAFKDQSAYFRPLDYGNPTRAEAEEIFNWFMADPIRSAAYPTGTRALDDYLFNAFLRMAHELELPVQIHTGHMAGLYGDVTHANAIKLAPLLMLHRDVRFDLFHANWPYSGELLYLGKAYPNVALNFCWTNVIDPVYCQDLFRQALASVPHSKIHAFGSDFGGFGFEPGGGYADRAWAHAQMARENVAIALSDMVEMGYINLDQAQEIARAWLYDNPNRFYRLGLK
jgi:hypothetical protein